MHWLKVHRIPEIGADGKGKAVVNLIQIGPGERVAAMIAVREFAEDQYIVLATKRGFIKKTRLSAYSNPRSVGIIAISVEEDDEVLAAGLSDGNHEVFMATASGKSIRFQETDVRPMGRTARGVIAIRTAKTDRLVEMEILQGMPDILTVSRNGYGKKTDVGEYRIQGRGGSGIINMRTTQRNGEVVASMEIDNDDQVLIITANGKIIRMNASGVSRIGRATQGVRLIQLDEDDQVVSAIRTAEREENGNGGSGTGDREESVEDADTGEHDGTEEA